MPGRSRTGSSPSRTVMSFPVYAVSVTALLEEKMPAKQAVLRACESISETAVGAGGREARGDRPADGVAELRDPRSPRSRRRASASSGAVGARGLRAAALLAPRGTGPGRARSGATAAWRRRASARSLPRTSSSSRPSSNAQVEDTVVTCSVPSRRDALRPRGAGDRRAHGVGPGPGHRRERAGVGNAGAAERAANRRRRAAPSGGPHLAGGRPRGAARARAGAPRRPSR